MTSFDKSAYDQQYARENIIRKQLPFNKANPDDMAMLNWLDTHGNVTRYIKSLIARDMEKHGGA